MKKKVFIYQEEFRIFCTEISVNEAAKEAAIEKRVFEKLDELQQPSGWYGVTTLNEIGKEEKFLFEYKAESEGRGTSEEE